MMHLSRMQINRLGQINPAPQHGRGRTSFSPSHMSEGPLRLCTEHFLLVAFSNCCHDLMFPLTAAGLQAIVSNFSSSHNTEAAVSTLYLAMVKATKSSACVTSLVSKGRICSANSQRKVLLPAPIHHPQFLLPDPATNPLLGHLKKKKK